MTTHVALLRAVNVGGRGKVAMADLRDCMRKLAFSDVQTVLQSGNIVLSSDHPGGCTLEAELESAFLKHLKLRTDVIVRSAKAWEKLVAGNPFTADARDDPSHLLAVVTKQPVSAKAVDALRTAVNAAGGREAVGETDRQIYLTFPDGIGRSKVTTALIERALGTVATARNWNTVLKLAELAAKMGR